MGDWIDTGVETNDTGELDDTGVEVKDTGVEEIDDMDKVGDTITKTDVDGREVVEVVLCSIQDTSRSKEVMDNSRSDIYKISLFYLQKDVHGDGNHSTQYV